MDPSIDSLPNASVPTRTPITQITLQGNELEKNRELVVKCDNATGELVLKSDNPGELVLKCDNTTQVKDLIKQSGVDAKNFRIFSSSEVVLPEEKTLIECGVQEKETLFLRYVSTFLIQVRMGNSDIKAEIYVSGCDTIGKVRTQLGPLIGGTSSFCLICNGKRLEDSKTISDYQIKSSHVFYVVPTNRSKDEVVPVNLHIHGNSMLLKLPLFTSIKDLLDRYLENCTGWVITNENQILDPLKTLHDYSVVDEETLYAFPPMGKIIFLTSHLPGLTSTQPRLIFDNCTIGELARVALESSRFTRCTEYALVHKGQPDECGTRSETIFDEKSASSTLKDLKVLEEQGQEFHFIPTPPSNVGCQELFVSLKGASNVVLSVPVDLQSDSILTIKKKLRSSPRHNPSLRAILERVPYTDLKLLYRSKELDHFSTLHLLEFTDGSRLEMIIPESSIKEIVGTAVIDLSALVDASKLAPEDAHYEELRRTWVKNREALATPKNSIEEEVSKIRATTFDPNPARNADLQLVGELMVRGFDDAGTQLSFTDRQESNIRMLNSRPDNQVVSFNLTFDEAPGTIFQDLKNNPQLAKEREMEIRKFISSKLDVPLEYIVVASITAGTVHFDVIVPAHLIIKHPAQVIRVQKQIFDAKTQLAAAFLLNYPNFIGSDAVLLSLRDNFQFSMGDFDARGDFRFPTANGETQKRGSLDYYQPNNKWRRLGLRVLGLYQDGDDWIKMDGNANEWAVGFHGPNGNVDSFKGIGISRMVCLANANAYGGNVAAAGTSQAGNRIPTVGIYFSQDVETCYKTAIAINGKNYEIAFQCRVHPAHVYLTGNGNKWFVVDDPRNVRPYGILLKEV